MLPLRKIGVISAVALLLCASFVIPTASFNANAIFRIVSVVGDYKRTYTIHDDYGRSIQFAMDIPEETYEYYRRQPHTVYSFDDYEKFVTPEMFENIALALAEYCSNARSFVMAALEIAQQIPYEPNDEAYYPIETLIRNRGACDDKSFLAASIILARGYYTILLLFESENHMAIGVALSDFHPEYTVWYWEYRGREYYYCECTSLGWKIGEMPPEFEGVEAYIIDLGGSIVPPCYVDSDGDGLTDDEELVHGTSPYKSDTDNDGLSDYYEIFTTQTDPTKADSDNDGLNDGEEVSLGTDPLKADTDNDLWNDSIDPSPRQVLIPNILILVATGLIAELIVITKWPKKGADKRLNSLDSSKICTNGG